LEEKDTLFGENYWSASSPWQILSHIVASSTPSNERGSISQH